MKYDFDKIIDRQNSASVKWDLCDLYFKVGGIEYPMWVADMDFQAADPIKEALKNCADHGVFGYTFTDKRYLASVVGWFKRRHNWEIDRNWLEFSPGIIPAVSMLIQEFSNPGDGVIVQRPVYYPFFDAIKLNERRLVNNPLLFDGTTYTVDFDDLEEKAALADTTMMILTNPHNPVGRSWSREELTKIGDICLKHNVMVISDEIHCDLVFKGKYVPFASIKDDFLNNSITCTAPSKTFNIAGLHVSNLIIADEQNRCRYKTAMQRNGLMGPTSFAAAACTAAYEAGDEWLDQLLDYLSGNMAYVKSFLKENLPMVTVIEPEATYLLWLDFRKISTNPAFIEKTMLEKAKVALDNGDIFGEEGNGFTRVNIACPRETLKKAMSNIADAFRE